jgi:hypothetical protein
MKRMYWFVVGIICPAILFFAFQSKLDSEYLEGDIIFQSSNSSQCNAIKLATHSEYSHVGMITIQNDKPYVLEAVEPVCLTPLNSWIARGTGEHFTRMRLKKRESVIKPETAILARSIGKSMLGKHYDLYFGWSDDQLYCSELVWKVYKRGCNLELCPLRKMKDFDLTSAEVKAIMKQRYGNNPPLEEQVIAPSDLSESELLYVVEKK